MVLIPSSTASIADLRRCRLKALSKTIATFALRTAEDLHRLVSIENATRNVNLCAIIIRAQDNDLKFTLSAIECHFRAIS